jgi:RND family efflux transporter MFP subunit
MALLLAIACGALWLAVRQQAVAPQAASILSNELPSTQVTLGEATTLTVAVPMVRPGEVVAARRFTLAPRSSGRLAALDARPGDRLAAGALVATLVAPELTQSRAQLAAELEATRAELTDAEGDLVRVRSLAKTRTVSDDDLRDAIVRRDRAKAVLAAAKAALAARDAELSELRVTAPEALIVVKRLRDPGDLAGPALPILEVESAADLRFEAWLPQAASTSSHAGMPATLVLDGHELLMDVRVSRVLDSADPLTRTRKLEVDLPAGAGLMAGTYGEIRILQGEVSTTVVPARALIERAGVVGLFVLDEGELAQNARVHYRSVRTGRRLGRHVEVLAGVRPGEAVVLDAGPGLLDGARVKTTVP